MIFKRLAPIYLFVSLVGVACSTAENPGEVKRPNIVFIMSDDHAFQAISAYGSKINTTPNIDKLADQGMLFNRSYVTNSICGPSRAVMLTGKFSHLNGFMHNGNSFDGSQQTFPKLLQKAGYKTAVVGKWHLKTAPTGFDYWSVLPGQGDYYYPNFITMGERAQENGYVTDLITDKAIGWLDSAINQDEPFALLIHHKGPHRTWMPAIRHLSNYKGKNLPEPETLFDNYETRENTAGAQEMSIASHLQDKYDLFLGIGMGEVGDWGNNYLNNQAGKMDPSEVAAFEDTYREENQAFAANPPTGEDRVRWNYQRYIKNYLAVVDGVDENIGRVMTYLDEKGLDKNTIVVYTSDQGFYLGDHGWFDKRWMYEESFRMPLIVRYPELIESGVRTDQLVQNLDFAPTFLDLAGIEIPEEMQGISMKKAFMQQEPEIMRDGLYYHYYEYPGVHAVKRHYGIMHNNFKLMHFYHDVDKWEMYDLDKDPNELSNIYDNPEYNTIKDDLLQRLRNLQVQYGDTADLTPPKLKAIENKGKGSKLQFELPPTHRSSKNGEVALVDGQIWEFNPTFSNYQNNFQGFDGQGAEFTVDLGSSKSIGTILVHAMQEPESWIHYPELIEVSTSIDNREFKPVMNQKIPPSLERGHEFFGNDIENTTARYVKFKIRNVQSIPEGSPAVGQVAWAFIDEVIIN